MSVCREKVPWWRRMLLFIACMLIYLYIYTNVFDGINSSSVFRVVEGDLRVWKEKLGPISYYLKLKEESNNSLKIMLSVADAKTTSASTHLPDTQLINVGQVSSNVNYTLLNKLGAEILDNKTQPLLTLFTSWTDSPDKYLVHNITTNNWIGLRPFVIPVIFTNDASVAEECSNKRWETRHVSVTAAEGIPVLKYMFKDVIDNYKSTFYAYSNGDILFPDTLINTLLHLRSSSLDISKPALIVGKRTNVDSITYSEGSTWDSITKIAKERGELFIGLAEDYFITTRSYQWNNIAEVVIGRRAYDNWLVYMSRKSKYTVIDSTMTLLAVHQTTKTGNYEGHRQRNSDFNHKLLRKLYKRVQYKYSGGVIECVGQYTDYDHEIVSIKSRAVPKNCLAV